MQNKIDELMSSIEAFEKKEQKLNKKIEAQRASLKEWEKNSKKVYKELKHKEIM